MAIPIGRSFLSVSTTFRSGPTATRPARLSSPSPLALQPRRLVGRRQSHTLLGTQRRRAQTRPRSSQAGDVEHGPKETSGTSNACPFVHSRTGCPHQLAPAWPTPGYTVPRPACRPLASTPARLDLSLRFRQAIALAGGSAALAALTASLQYQLGQCWRLLFFLDSPHR